MRTRALVAPRRRRWAALAAVAAGGFVTGCSTYAYRAQEIRPLVVQGRYDAALSKLEGMRQGGSRLLYHYERGLILHQQDRYAESNAELEHAEDVLDDLYTRSLSREAGALVTSDNVVEYRGERFEAALVHYYKALNYLYLGAVEDAAVEARRLNHRLQVYADEGGSTYRDDPFLQYFTGLVYERAGERVDADVSLRRALEAYREQGRDMPPGLLCDLAASAARLGDREAAAEYAADGGCGGAAAAAAVPAGAAAPPGVLHLFLECGHIPALAPAAIVLPILEGEITEDLDRDAYCRDLSRRHRGWDAGDARVEYLLRVSLPTMVATPSGIEYARVRALVAGDSLPATTTVVGSDLSRQAFAAFEARQGTILLRAVTRAFLKYLASRSAKKKKGEVAGFLVNIVGVATESADTRTWSTLPERILLARLELPPGTYQLDVDLRGRAGRRDDRFQIPEVEIRSGQATLLNYRVY